MKIKYLMLFLITQFLMIPTSYAQDETVFNPLEKFPVDSLKLWTKELMKSVEEGHPGFYWYTEEKAFTKMIDSTINTITEPLETIDYYRKLKPLFAQIGCLHTAISLSSDYKTYMNEVYSLVPIQIFIDKNRTVFITDNLSDNSDLKIKSELLSINGKPIATILSDLLNAIPSDGYNETLKIALLNLRFAFWYQTTIEFNTDYEIKVNQNNEVKTFHLKGVKNDAFPSFESQEGSNKKQLSFKIDKDVAFLKVNTFAKSTIKQNGQNYKKYLKNVFKDLEEKKVQKLVIDLRNNTGGTDGNAVLLASYFFDTPFKYWDKIEVTKDIAEQVTGIGRIFYKKPVKQNPSDSLYQWFKVLQSKEFDYYETQKPAKRNFKGEVYILTNGLCMSSCSDFVAILSENNIAKVIGQETGGGFQGNTSGMIPEEEINANMFITIPLQKYTNAVSANKNFGRGTIPDYKIYPTIEEWIAEKDVELNFIKEFIKKN